MFTKNQRQILAVLISQPDQEYYLSELGNVLQKHPGTFQKGINSLEKRGIIISRRKGNQRFFRINTNNPLFEEIKGIVQKTEGAEGLLRELINRIKYISIAIIYGTYAKNSLRADSDIDLLVVADNPKAEDILLDKLEYIEKKLQREINYKIYSAEEFNANLKRGDPFLTEILSDKYIILKGNP
jgi:predicted nucleotidyltransferase